LSNTRVIRDPAIAVVYEAKGQYEEAIIWRRRHVVSLEGGLGAGHARAVEARRQLGEAVARVERGQALMAKHTMETIEEAEQAEERALYPQAIAQAGQASSIMLEGQEEDPQHDKMGVYKLMEGKEQGGE
jgi:hypothetical protein